MNDQDPLRSLIIEMVFAIVFIAVCVGMSALIVCLLP